uniref:Ig-like domain-containing protein n=1 Tax=Equus asinus asinus TaxID=83772 RepID=A0A8C4PUQ4_EQUAS
MSPKLTFLLCLASDFPPGTLPKPTIWAEPGSVISWGKPVAICGQGTLEAKEYLVYGEGSSVPWDRQQPLKPKAKVRFSIPHMEERHAGRHRCYYLSPTGWSVTGSVLMGIYRKPSLSALPSPVVTSGGFVTLQCISWQGFDRFILTKEGEHRPSWTLDSQRRHNGQFQALFPVGPVTPSYRWTFRCCGCYRYIHQQCSEPSDPVELLVPGEHVLPLSHPYFKVTDKGLYSQESPRREGGVRVAGVSPGAETQNVRDSETWVSSERGLGTLSSEEDTAPHPPFLSLGVLPDTPSLSVQPGPTVAVGENMTLLCQTRSQRDILFLSKEGTMVSPLRLRSKYQAQQYQAQFSMSPVTSAHGGTYRCYSSFSTSPYELSHPSDALELVVSGERHRLCSSALMTRISLSSISNSKIQDYTEENPIRMGMSALIMVVLRVLLVHSAQSENDPKFQP